MTTKTFTMSAVLLAGLLLSQPALALDFPRIQVQFPVEINKACAQPDGYDPVWGCLDIDGPTIASASPTVYIRRDIPSQLLPYVYLHSVGQYVLKDYSDQELEAVFNPPPQAKSGVGIRYIAANAFTFWVLGGTTTPAKVDFFRAAIAR